MQKKAHRIHALTTTHLSQYQWQLIRFGFVGATTYVITVGSFIICQNLLSFSRLWAATCAYVSGMLFHFTANKLFTFGNRERRVHGQILKYIIVCGGNYLISLCILEVLVRRCHAPELIAFSSSVATTTALGFVAIKYWVFGKDGAKMGQPVRK